MGGRPYRAGSSFQERLLREMERTGGEMTRERAIKVAGWGYLSSLGALQRRGLVVYVAGRWRRTP